MSRFARAGAQARRDVAGLSLMGSAYPPFSAWLPLYRPLARNFAVLLSLLGEHSALHRRLICLSAAFKTNDLLFIQTIFYPQRTTVLEVVELAPELLEV
jgi:hypothetical protein